MGVGAAGQWTPALVLIELEREFRRMPPLYSPRSAEMISAEADHAPVCVLDLIRISETCLGRDSSDRIALITRARAIGRPAGASIRDMCRERFGWVRSRAALYRRSNRAARQLADHLNAMGFPLPGQPLAGETTTVKMSVPGRD